MTKDEVIKYLYENQDRLCRETNASLDYRDDVIQDVALYLYELEYVESTNIDSYLRDLINHTCNTYRNKPKLQSVIKDSYKDAFPCIDDVTPAQPVQNDLYGELRELRERVVSWAMGRIPGRHREILLQVSGGKSVKEYGDQNLMEYNAARQLHHRAKKSLETEIHKALIPDSLLRLGEGDKMSPDLLNWLVKGPYSDEILSTEIGSDLPIPTAYIQSCTDPSESLEGPCETIDHSLDEQEESYSVPQNEEQL